MLSHPRDSSASHQWSRLDWHGADDLILRARHQRDRWLGQVLQRASAWLAGTGVGRLVRSKRRERRAEVRELLALDERTLRDIGLRREDLLAVAHGETTLERLNAERLGGSRGALVELKSRARRQAPAPLDRAA